MSRVDPVAHLWTNLGNRVATAAAACVAFVSLAWEASVLAASLRGAATWLALVLCTRIGRWLIERTLPGSDGTETGGGIQP